jgi:hypothetical protein
LVRTIKFLGFSIVFILVICGFVGGSPSEQILSDDDLFLQVLDDFSFSTFSSPNNLNPPESLAAVGIKIRATSFQERVKPLKVSSKFEKSKAAFLQLLTEQEAVADFLLDYSPQEQVNMAAGTTAQKKEYREFEKHGRDLKIFSAKAFDSAVCTAAGEDYPNVTAACKNIREMKK